MLVLLLHDCHLVCVVSAFWMELFFYYTAFIYRYISNINEIFLFCYFIFKCIYSFGTVVFNQHALHLPFWGKTKSCWNQGVCFKSWAQGRLIFCRNWCFKLGNSLVSHMETMFPIYEECVHGSSVMSSIHTWQYLRNLCSIVNLRWLRFSFLLTIDLL